MHIQFLYQDRVCLDWFKHFTAAWPFQCLIIGITNGNTRLRLKYISVAHHHTPTFESSCMVTISVHIPTFHTKIMCVCTNSSNWQELDPSEWTRLRLEFIVYHGHHNLFLSCEWGQMWLDPHPFFTIYDQVCLDWFKLLYLLVAPNLMPSILFVSEQLPA